MTYTYDGLFLNYYMVVDTDYDSYSIEYSCRAFIGLGKIEYIWVFTRDALTIGSTAWITMNTKIMSIIQEKFQKLEADRKYKYTDTLNFLSYTR